MKTLKRSLSVFLTVVLVFLMFSVLQISGLKTNASTLSCGIFKDANRQESIDGIQVSIKTSLYFCLWVEEGVSDIDYATLTIGSDTYYYNDAEEDYSSICRNRSFTSTGTYTVTWEGRRTDGTSFYFISDFTIKDKPHWNVKTTNKLQDYQSMTITLKDEVGVAGYYFGNSDIPENNSFTSVSDPLRTSVVVSKDINATGTYYLTTRDIYGNISSNKPSFTFYRTYLNANGGSVSLNSILTKNNSTVNLPTPTRSGYTFLGWATSPTATKGVTTISPASSETYYAIWEKSYEFIDTTVPIQPTTIAPYTISPIAPTKIAYKKSQIIKVKSFTKSYGSKPFNLNAKASGGKLSYSSKNHKAAVVNSRGKVTINGCGVTKVMIKCNGNALYKAASKVISIIIKPGKVKIKKLSKKSYTGNKYRVAVKYNEQKNCDGYDIKVSLKKNIPNSKKVTASKSFKYAKYKNSIPLYLSKNTAYYAKIRAYKTINGTKYYGKWSAVKKIQYN